MGIFIDVHGVKLAYASEQVLENIEFTVRRGDMVALLGANGAGKTTLLRCLSRILKPTAGSILIDARDLRQLKNKEIARMIAVVPQETPADFDFSVEEIVMMGRFPYTARFSKEDQKDRDIVRQAMTMTGIAHLADRSIATLSGGEKQRTIMARAVAQQPDVLLLDEPTANLDIGYQSVLLEMAAGLNREQNVTIIAAIHDINLAVQHFSRFILLSAGKVLAAGSAQDVITSSNIQKSYGVFASIYRHPLHGVLQVSVERGSSKSKNGPRIHVIGGGEESLPVLELLHRSGCRISVGPVSKQDSSFGFASFHGLPVIALPPFTGIKDEYIIDHMDMMRQAQAVVVPAIPIGQENLPIIEQVNVLLDEGKPVIIMDLAGAEKRDYCAGKAFELLKKMVQKGACALDEIEALTKISAIGGGRNYD